MTKNSVLIPRETRELLEAGAKGDTNFYWLIADKSIEVMANYLEKRENGEYPYHLFSRGDVWTALSKACCKSPGRIKIISQVGAMFQPAVRCSIEMRFGYWEFGYYEKISLMPARHWDAIFQFLLDYENGELVSPGRRLGVGEFIFLFEKHILGKDKETVNQPNAPGSADEGQYSSGIISPSLPFQDMLRTSYALEGQLSKHSDKGAVKMVLYHLKELKKHLPQAMRDCGVTVPVDDIAESF